MFPTMRVFALPVVLCLLAASLGAQSYTRFQTTLAYAERGGAPVPATLVGDLDDGALAYILPFDFPFFDRNYRQVFMNTNGQLAFSTADVTSAVTGSLAAPVGPVELRAAINVFRVDLCAGDRSQNLGIYPEAGRVVFQWRRVACAANAGAVYFNFQCHVFPNGNIELHYGPELVGFNQDTSFVSGIVSPSGGQSFAGFNNLLSVQTARPANGQLVTLAPTGYVYANGVDLTARLNAWPAASDFQGDNRTFVVGAFTLHPREAGGLVSGITVRHMSVAAMDGLSLVLYRDQGQIGVLEGNDVPLGGGPQSMAGASSTGFALSESIVAASVNYLLVVESTAFTTYFQRGINAAPFSILPALGDVACSVGVTGGLFSEVHEFASGPVARVAVSRFSETVPLARAGQSNVVLLSFELRNVPAHGNAIVTGMNFTLSLSGLAASDLSSCSLYREGSGSGGVDATDTLLSSISDPVSASLSFSCSEYLTQEGADYLLVCAVRGAFAGNGSVSASVTSLAYAVAGNVAPLGSAAGVAVLVAGTGNTVLLRPRPEASLAAMPVAATSSNNPANAFLLQTSFGTTTVSGLVFRGNTTGISGANLYRDSGSTPGRLDAGDTLVCAGVVVSGVSGTVTCTPPSPISIDAAGSTFLLTADFTAATAGVSHTLSLATADISALTAAAGANVTGCTLTVQPGSANGVDVNLFQMSRNAVFGGSQLAVLARLRFTGRGMGGDAPSLRLGFTHASGGAGKMVGLRALVFLEGAGPLGILDATDMLLYCREAAPLDDSVALPLLLTGSPLPVTGVRNLLICLGRASRPVSGEVTVAFKGIEGGTDVQWLATQTPQSTAVSVRNAAVNTVGGRDEYGDEGPRCSTGEDQSAVVTWLGLLALLVACTRWRRLA